jgi:large subunit ribosomal protein L13
MLQRKTYQAKQCGPHIFEPKGPNAPKWYVVDAKDQVVGRLATVLARVITGKHRPTYSRHADTGDFVIVLNAEKVVFTRNKWNTKLYRYHSGYVGGLRTFTARQMQQRNPEKILREAVWGMTSKSCLARHQMNKLKIYVGEKHPHSAQNPQALPLAAVRRTVVAKKTAKHSI